jgi:hypothetical protein
VAQHITLTSKNIFKILLGIIFFLLTVNLLIIYLRFVAGYEHLKGFIHGFYFDAEANFPSSYSAFIILLAAILLWRIGNLPLEQQQKHSLHWKFLSLVFIFLAMDEFASLHEDLIEPVRAMVNNSVLKSDYLYFAWLIPYIFLALLLGIVFLKFLFKLPVRTRILFIFSAALYLSGAVVMEMIGGKYWAEQNWAPNGKDVDIRYALIITVEELLEMLGMATFVYALLSYYLRYDNARTFLIQLTDTKK